MRSFDASKRHIWYALPVRLRFIAALGVLALGSIAAVACGSQVAPEGQTPLPQPEGGVIEAGAPDAPVVQPSCTTTDLPPGKGPKFCDLPLPDSTILEVPPEFCVKEFTKTPLAEARVIRFAPNGDLFVAAPSMLTPGGAADGAGAIFVLPDEDGDGQADSAITYAGTSPRSGGDCATLETDPNNLACVHGIVFADNYLYFTRSDEVRRFAFTKGDRRAPPTSELVARLGGAKWAGTRWTHTLEQHHDGSIYVSRGRGDSSDCSLEEMERGAVFALHVEVPNAPLPLTPELVANGFRNPMYLRCAPNSCNDCYASELTGDNWTGSGGREKLALLEKTGESWGFPCCVARNLPAPGFPAQNCSATGHELVSIPIHDTPFGLDFERGTFPEPYRHGTFVALHGVVTTFGGTGVVYFKADPKSLRPTGQPTMFVKGFGLAKGGRATDVTFAPDGRLFIADDTSGRIYWVAPRTLAKPQ